MFDLSILHASSFYELTALLVLAGALGFIGLALKQPMIVSFIAVGLLAGPHALGILHSYEKIETLAELGVAILLFLVGLKLDIKLIRTMGLVSLTTGLGQVVFTSIIGYFIGLGLGLSPITSLYIAVALTFSSTIIIVKLLSDKKETDSLHGRIAIGFLIVQDLVVVLAMVVLSAFGVGTETDNGGLDAVGKILFYGIIMLSFVGFFIRFIASPLLSKISHSPELLVTFSIAWAALLAAMGSYFGFSKELGGLLAGVSLASTAYREAIVARLSSLRDFLLLFFFIALGSKLDLSLLGAQLFPAFIFSVFVLLGNPLIVLIIMGALGYRKRTGFLAGLTVAQISEFSLIFMAMGISLGHVSQEALGLVTLVGIITIALSVYMITYSHQLYRLSEPILGIFERQHPSREVEAESEVTLEKSYDLILFGIGRYGSAIAKRLKKLGWNILAIDFNPDEVKRRAHLGFDTIYGDACDQDFLETLPLKNTKWVVSTLPQHDLGLTHEDPRLALLDSLKSQGFAGKIAIATHSKLEVSTFQQKGADLVLMPFEDAADRAVEKIAEDDFSSLGHSLPE